MAVVLTILPFIYMLHITLRFAKNSYEKKQVTKNSKIKINHYNS